MFALAVIDIETTGLNPYRNDRIIEIASVLIMPGRGIIAEFDTLVNPDRDIGPTSIHGITASHVVNAPRFIDICRKLAEFLSQSVVLVGHNVRFDLSFLSSEFKRINIDMPHYNSLDTMFIAGGGTLSECCKENGISFQGRIHSALHDARATAELLQKMIEQTPDLLAEVMKNTPPTWPNLPAAQALLLPRGKVEESNQPAVSYLQRLNQSLSSCSVNMPQPEAERDYRALLWRALDDGKIDEHENNSLVDIAIHWGLTIERIQAIHLEYFCKLADAALKDDRITDMERSELQSAAQLFGFGNLTDEEIQNLLLSYKADASSTIDHYKSEDLNGMTVCFTGESSCYLNGALLSRERAERVASSKGLLVKPSVTKKLDILVVADANTQSGKAKKARQYGVRIIHDRVFWRLLGINID